MILEISELTKKFNQGGSSIQVLRGANLSLEAGTTSAILGRSGSGKSTLLSLLSGLDTPSSGIIKISGQNISSMTEDSLAQFRARSLGIVFQQFHLMPHLTAIENISLPLEIAKDPKAQGKALASLKAVGLLERAGHFPEQLSGGEKQRIAIARALVVEPALLLADEPSGNLDVETGQQVMELLFDLVKTRHSTLLLVTHNRELASRCDRQFELEAGILRELGSSR